VLFCRGESVVGPAIRARCGSSVRDVGVADRSSPRRAFSVVWGVLGLHLGRAVSADRRIGCFRVRYRAIPGRCWW
jgi:hypothetical protein